MDSYSTLPIDREGKASFSHQEYNEVQDFLEKLHLDQYIPVFIDEGFESLQAVQEITEEDLIALNVKRGHRRVIQRGIATLNGIPPNQPLMVINPTATAAVITNSGNTTNQQSVQPQQASTSMRSKSNNGNNSSEGSSYTTSGYGSMSSPKHVTLGHQQQYESSNSSSQYANPQHHHVQEQLRHLIIQHHQQPQQEQAQQSANNVDKNGVNTAEGSRSSSFSSNGDEDNEDDDANAPSKRKYRRHPKPDKTAPIKPPSAYIMFSNDTRAQIKVHNMTFVEIAKLVGDQWKNLSTNQKQQYERTSMRAKDEYIGALNAYRQTEEYKTYQIYLNNFKSEQDATNRKIARLRKRAKRESPGSGSMADNSSNGFDINNIKNQPSDVSLGSSNSTDGGFNENDNARSSSSSGSTDIYKVHLKNHPPQPLPPSSIKANNNNSLEEGSSSIQTTIRNNTDPDQPIIEDEDEEENNGGECYSPQQNAPPLVDDSLLKENYHRLPFKDKLRSSQRQNKFI